MRKSHGSVLATLLFTDIVESSQIADELGDRRWREALARHNEIVRRELKRFNGREIDTAGDGFFAAFSKPAEAIRCACAVVEAVRALGLEIRAGLHAGEAEQLAAKLSGVTVHVAARTMSAAVAGEVVVTGLVKDLIPGAGIRFEDRGRHRLKGVPGEWHLYAVRAIDGRPLSGPLESSVKAERLAAIQPPPFRRRARTPLLAGAATAVVALIVVAALVASSGTPPSPSPISSPSGSALAQRDRLVRISRAGSQASVEMTAIEVGGDPWAAAVGEGSVWVANQADGTVSRIDPVTNRSQAVIDVGARPVAIAFGEGSMWVANRLGHSVSRIDPARNEVVATIELDTSSHLNSIAVGAGGVWVGADGTGDLPAIHRIDPSSNRDVATIQAGDGIYVLVGTGEDSVWAATPTGLLLRIDPRTNEAKQVGNLPSAAAAITVSEGSVWIATLQGKVARIEPSSGRVEATIPGGGVVNCVGQCQSMIPDVITSMATGDGLIWVADKTNAAISRIVPGSNTTLRPISIGQTPTGVAVGYGSVWVTVDATGQ